MVDVETSIWCQRRDLSPRDQLQIGENTSVVLNDVYFVVRAGSADWAVGDRMTFEGEAFTIRSVSELLGREQYLLLLARSIT